MSRAALGTRAEPEMMALQLLVAGVLVIYTLNRLTRWMHRQRWIRWRMRRGTSSGLGNAMLAVQMIYQPQVREVLEARLEEPDDAAEQGDPPTDGHPAETVS